MHLIHMLEPGEKVECDKGYRSNFPGYVKCPPFINPDTAELQARVRLRHETCNRRLKMWGILSKKYRHDIMNHQAVFGAIACLTQLLFENGQPLFPVEDYVGV